MKSFALALCLLTAPQTLDAQTGKTALNVYCQPGDHDLMGSQLCTALRDKVATSPRYSLTDEAKFNLSFVVITAEISSSNATAVGWTLTMWSGEKTPNSFFTSGVRVCGTGGVDICAAGLLASIDNYLASIARMR